MPGPICGHLWNSRTKRRDCEGLVGPYSVSVLRSLYEYFYLRKRADLAATLVIGASARVPTKGELGKAGRHDAITCPLCEGAIDDAFHRLGVP